MTDAIQTWLSNARGAEFGFLGAATYAVEQFQERNNKPMYALIAFTNGKKFGSYKINEGYKMTQFATPLRHILNHTLANTKFTFKKDGTASVKVGPNGGVNADMLATLKALADEGHGPKSDKFKEHFPASVKPKVELDADTKREKFLEAIERLAEKYDYDKATMAAILTA